MKGIVQIRFALPNISRLRSRLENPPKELTSDLRKQLAQIVAQVVNENSLSVKAKLVDYIMSREDLKFKTKEHKEYAANMFTGMYEIVAAENEEILSALLGTEEDEEEAPKEEKAPVKKEKKAKEEKAEEVKEDAPAGTKDPDEFE